MLVVGHIPVAGRRYTHARRARYCGLLRALTSGRAVELQARTGEPDQPNPPELSARRAAYSTVHLLYSVLVSGATLKPQPRVKHRLKYFTYLAMAR
jgi:hypothetical protein